MARLFRGSGDLSENDGQRPRESHLSVAEQEEGEGLTLSSPTMKSHERENAR